MAGVPPTYPPGQGGGGYPPQGGGVNPAGPPVMGQPGQPRQGIMTSELKTYKGIKELILCFQKLVSGKLHTFYSWRFPRLGILSRTLESGPQSPTVHD